MVLNIYGKIDDLSDVLEFVDEYTGMKNIWRSESPTWHCSTIVSKYNGLPEAILERFPELNFSGAIYTDIEPDGSRWHTDSFSIEKDENGNRILEWDSSSGWH